MLNGIARVGYVETEMKQHDKRMQQGGVFVV